MFLWDKIQLQTDITDPTVWRIQW